MIFFFESVFEHKKKLLPFWLSHLPLHEDELEARDCHALLVDFCEMDHPHILGEGIFLLSNHFNPFVYYFIILDFKIVCLKKNLFVF